MTDDVLTSPAAGDPPSTPSTPSTPPDPPKLPTAEDSLKQKAKADETPAKPKAPEPNVFDWEPGQETKLAKGDRIVHAGGESVFERWNGSHIVCEDGSLLEADAGLIEGWWAP